MPAIAALWLALAIDHWLGEPAARWHPVVWMGRYLGWTGSRIAPHAADAKPRDLRLFVAGALAWIVGAMLTGALALALQRGATQWLPGWVATVVLALALKPLFAWRMLRGEVLAVETALAVSLDAGRAQLARLVSRDVAVLGERGGRDWTWVGKWAARADDVLSWLPARLTVLLLTLAAWRWPAGIAREARRTPSPPPAAGGPG